MGDIETGQLRRAELVLTRDTLVHHDLARARRVIGAIVRSGATWFLATAFPGLAANADIALGGSRPLNL